MKKVVARNVSFGVAGVLAGTLVLSAPSLTALAEDRAFVQDSSAQSAASQGEGGLASSVELPASTAGFSKSEIVYATLDWTGAPEAAYVVNLFDVESAGRVVDYGSYSAIKPLSEEKQLERVGDAVSFEVEEGSFSYQGDVAAPALPWNVQMSYELNGEAVTAQELAGATGVATIHVKTTANDVVDRAFFDSYMMQITFTLPGDACVDVRAPGATLARSGSDRTVAFTVLPGHEGDFTITADVKDFHLPSAQIAALPYTSVVELPSTEGLTGGMTQLSDAVGQLSAGSSQFASGMGGYGAGLAALDASGSSLVAGSAQIDAAFKAIGEALAPFDPSQLDKLAEMPALVRKLADSLDDLAATTTSTYDRYTAAIGALDAATAAQDAATVTEDQLRALREATEGSPEATSALDALVASQEAGGRTREAYAAHRETLRDAEGVLEAVANQNALMVETAKTLRNLAAQMDAYIERGGIEELKGMVEGVAQMTGAYGQFHAGLAQYVDGVYALAANFGQLEAGAADMAGGLGQLNASTVMLPETMRSEIEKAMADYDFPAFEPRSFTSSDNGSTCEVQFVLATEPIEMPREAVEPEPEPELSVWDRFLALFADR